VLLHVARPSAAGSGIPQLKLAFWKEFGWSSPRIMWVKFVAGALSIGSGMRLGREGPSVKMAGTMASVIATRLGVVKSKHRIPAAAGAQLAYGHVWRGLTPVLIHAHCFSFVPPARSSLNL
jgi:H+/Cl- antiporter ClcA